MVLSQVAGRWTDCTEVSREGQGCAAEKPTRCLANCELHFPPHLVIRMTQLVAMRSFFLCPLCGQQICGEHLLCPGFCPGAWELSSKGNGQAFQSWIRIRE